MMIQIKPFVTSVLLASNLGVGALKPRAHSEPPSEYVSIDRIDRFFCDNTGQCSTNGLIAEAPFDKICSKNSWSKPVTRAIDPIHCNASTIDRQECLIFQMAPYPVTVTKFGRQDVEIPNVLVVTGSHGSKVFKRLIELYGNSFTRPNSVASNWVIMREGVADSEMAKSASNYFNGQSVLPFDAFGSVDKSFEDGETSCKNSAALNSTAKWYDTYFKKRNRAAMKRLNAFRKKHDMPNVYLSVGDNHGLPIANNPIYNMLVQSSSAWLVRPFKQFYSDDCQAFLFERYEVWRETCKTKELPLKQLAPRILMHKMLAEQYPKNIQAQASYVSILNDWTKYNIELAGEALNQELQGLIIDTVDQYKTVQRLYPSNEVFDKKWAFVDWVVKESHGLTNTHCRKKLVQEAKIRDKEYAYYQEILGPKLIDKIKPSPLSSRKLTSRLKSI